MDSASSTWSHRSSRDLTPMSARGDPMQRLVYRPPKEYERKPTTIPFHIPHKKLLEKIEFKKELPEPLTGFKERQAKLRFRKLKALDKGTLDRMRKSSVSFDSEDISKASKEDVTKEKVARIAFKTTETPKVARPVLEHIPKPKEPLAIADQNELISKVHADSDFNFVYMVYAVDRSSEFYTPYCLRVVPYEQIDKHNFLTISTHGVTQYYDDVMAFTPLWLWDHEYNMYLKILTIRMFRLFRIWKAFFVWRKSILFRKFQTAAKSLQNNLFILNPMLRDALLAIQAMCVKLEDANFTQTHSTENYLLFYFIEAQMGQIELIKGKLCEYRSVAKELINNACHGALFNAGFTTDDRNLRPSQTMAQSSHRKTNDGHLRMSYIEQAKKKRHCRRISCFIAAVDFMTVHMLHLLMVNSFGDFETLLRKHIICMPTMEDVLDGSVETRIEPKRPPTSPQRPLINFELLLDTKILTIDPSEEICFQAFTNLIDFWDEIIYDGMEPFLNDTMYNPFTSPLINNKIEERLIGNGPSLKFVLDLDVGIVDQRAKIFKYLEDNWLVLNNYIKRFEPLRKFYAEDCAMDRNVIKEGENLEMFRKWCKRYHSEIEFIESVVPDQNLALFHLDISAIKQTSIPQPESLLVVIEATLPWLGKKKVDTLLQAVDDAQEYLAKEPISTAEFVQYLDYLEKITMNVDLLESDLDYAKELYDIMEENSIPIPHDDNETYLNASTFITNLRNNSDRKIEEKEKTINKLSQSIIKDIVVLVEEVAVLKDEVMKPELIDIKSNAAEVTLTLERINDQLKMCQAKAASFRNYQKSYRLEVTRYDILDQVTQDVKLRLLLWDTLTSWKSTIEEWYTGNFNNLDPEEMGNFVAKNVKNVAVLEKGLPENKIVPMVKESVELMRDKLPVITYLRNNALKGRHWSKIEGVLNHKFKPDAPITLQLLEKLHVFSYPNELLEISGQASSEASLESMLKKVEDNWKSLEFIVIPHKDSKDIFILGTTEEVQAVLDESFITMNTINSSRNVGAIKPRVDEWLRVLDQFSRTLDEWAQVQQQWMYLEVIFSAPDIQRQLPTEAKMFLMVDKAWKDAMRRTAKVPLAMTATMHPGMLEMFQKANVVLDQIMKCLEAYLEVKRTAFPRFYFLSNDELLEILAQTRNPHAVQPHIRKCFDAIAKLEFGTKILNEDEDDENPDKPPIPIEEQIIVETNDIVAMVSPEGERVDLGKGLKARGNVEDWLCKVEEAMFLSLRRKLKFSLQDIYETDREEWLTRHPNQIILTVSQIVWAGHVHSILDGDPATKIPRMIEFEKRNIKDLNQLASIIRRDIDKVVRKILIALITIDVHARDTVTLLVTNKVQNSGDFEWLKMIRYYWDKEIDNCLARMSSALYVYGYEYLGAGGCLVITPLTDRCYLCLMGALQLDLGGAPAGPAGTGKTETTKDLSKALAIQCVVFNCSDTLDYKMMGKFFSGLATSGAWCCFDEFNRIDIEVLSVIAQQLITIRNAKMANAKRFMFEGREIKLVRSCAAFITMNPGYAGRTELPDNLKALFRPISMMVPDYGLIAEVTLYSEGFESSKTLAQKMVNMYKLCSEQLSQQDHYDFGMRAVKSVLVMAGALKRANPDKSEDVVLIRALRDSNLPKFLADDAVLFQGILSDLFPGVVLPEPDYGIFQSTIVEVILSLSLQSVATQIRKVIQLYETMIVRWGVMLVGPTGGGKTTVLKILNYSLTKMFTDGQLGPYFQKVITYVLNPKSVTSGELYGEVNPFTLEWRDGLLGIYVRAAVTSGNETHQWVVCDGPVDAVWIENLNTVLDDNKMLCLANSERIKLTPYVHMVFEVMDLSAASPATVSRCGMVYIDADELKWMPYVKTWVSKFDDAFLSQDLKDYIINDLFDAYVENGFIFIKKYCEHSINQVDISKVTMMCSLMESIFTQPGSMEKSMDKGRLKTYVIQCFVFAYIWGLGGNLTDNTRNGFEVYVREKQFEENEAAHLPTSSDLWCLFLNHQTKKLDMWSRLMPEFVYDPGLPFFEMLVPTTDTVRFGYIMEKMLFVYKAVMFTGDTGVGKSVIAKAVLNKLFAGGDYVPVTLNFSAQTSSMRTQEMLEAKLEKRRKTLLGAPYGKKIVVFVDDVNMPKLETYGAQPPIELLRQFLDFGGLYDRDKLFWKNIIDVTITCACAPPGGGRNPLTPRFVRHFAMLSIPSPDGVAMQAIFKAIIRGFFSDFSKDIQEIADPIVNAAVEIYERIAVDLLPTPAKSHYVFNLRDLSKCVQGILQADSGTLRDPDVMRRLFYHECLRVFHDRLICVEDKSYFFFLLREVCAKNLRTPVLILPEVPVITNPPLLLFGDFMVTSAPIEERLYEEIKDLDKLKEILMEYLDDYNIIATKAMKLIFFQDALEHCTRLARVIRSERGNALLVGVGGMGKQSVTKLASHVNACKCVQIELTRTYDHVSFFEDLRKMYYNAGCLGETTVFIFTDTQIVQEEFLEDVNNILNSGDVPNLFESDEYERVMVGIREPAKQAGILDATRDGFYDFFISKVRANLHLALCMSPVGDNFRRRCRMFPSLVNCCTIDWFTKWPPEALLSVADNALAGISEEDSTLGTKIAQICVTIHESVENMTHRFFEEMRRYYYTTPSSYLELLKLYRAMLDVKFEKIVKMRERIANGLKKLYETNEVVDSMKAELVAMEPALIAKSQAVADLVVTLTAEQEAADKVKVTVQADEANAKEKAAETQALADDAQRDLDTALPAMEAAAKALESLNKADINELRVFQKPPALVKFVMEPVCLLLGAKPDWDGAKKCMGDNFLKRLQEYDKNHISDKLLKKLVPYLEHKDFQPDIVAVVSKVCRSMCMWVHAIDAYAKVYKVVEPKMKRQKEAEIEFNQVMSVLKAKQKMLADVEAQIEALQANYQATLDEMKILEETMDITAQRLIRAGKLTSALGDEQGRWEMSVENFGKQLTNLVGDVLIAAAAVAYLGAFTLTYREELTSVWLTQLKTINIPSSDTFSLIAVLADPYEIRMWNTCGLPKDTVSIENAIFVTQAGRWPLMIDPQEQANRWIRTMEGPNGLKITKLTDANFMRVLEAGIRIGMPVLLEEVGETLDPTLSPILMKQTTVQGGRLMIRLGDSDVEYDTNFRFYVTTKLSNPHYLPEICIQVTIVNFTVTPSGLEDQLLADVVRLERPDLEIQRNDCIVRINNDKGQLMGIEDKILKLLFASEGNILDDEELIETLNESKETSAIIAARLIEVEATEEKITIAREKYRTVATRGSVLYFVVTQLAEIDPMYQFSLKYFNNVFNNVIDISEKNPDLNIRLNTLYREITLSVYTNISRGLFERHKLVYSFLLCVYILKQAGEISDSQWNFLLRGPVGAKPSTRKPDVPTLTDAAWTAVSFLEQNFANFQGITQECLYRIVLQVGDYVLPINVNPDNTEVAESDWNSILDEFDKLACIKALREEKLVFGITSFVKLKLGKAFVESPQVTIQLLYQDTNNLTPLVFVLSAGSDPFQAFQRFAADMGNTEKIQSISLGQGQGPVAEKMIERGKARGDWVFLQNCHLATSWMLHMERTIQKLSERGQKVHLDFRIFLSSMPSTRFPVSILQNSVKVTNEPPKGLRANIKRAFSEITEDYFENNALQLDWRKIIFGICMFHAIIQERKKFGPLGWNITYEFNDSDRECALNNFKMFCAEGFIPWDALEYITGEITYGGRVTDMWDLRCLKTILKGFFSPVTLTPGYTYSKSGTYHCPELEKLQEYREFIDNLPIIEDPEVFGMHENANIAFQFKETQAVILTIMECQPRAAGGGGGKSTDEIVFELSEMVKGCIMTRVYTEEPWPPIITRDERGRLPSLSTVLMQEIDRFNKLLKLIHTSMDTMQKAIKGLVVMSEALEEVYKAFINNQVPKMWAGKAYPSLKSLGSWIHDLVLRLDFIDTWLRCGPPLSFWISGFFFPQGFLTGCLQTHARKYDLPIDILKFDFKVTKIVVDQELVRQAHEAAGFVEDQQVYGAVPKPKDGVVIHGLFIDAARFDTEKGLLVDAKPGEMNPPLPAILLVPLTAPPPPDTRYVSPLYKTSVRAGVLSTTGHSTNFVVPVMLPSNETQSYWIMKGTALLTQITD